MGIRSITRIGVIGAGTMGRGIVQLFAQAGHQIRCHDAQPGAAQVAIDFVAGMISKSVDKGRIARDQADAMIDAMTPASSLADLSDCDLVIEAIVERIDIKRQLFAALEDIVADDAILASNTSSLVVSEIAAGLRHPERVAGLHFFNPVPLMKVAEVIAAVRTSAQTVVALQQLVAAAGHRAVVAADQPGFLVNHAGRGLYTEGLRILEEGVADVGTIDIVLREAAGFRMGPFELLDLTGLDVSGKVMESIYEQFQHEPRYRPSSLVPPRIAAGLHGRKTGEGWYRYDAAGKKCEDGSPSAAALPTGLAVWIDPAAEHFVALNDLIAGTSARRVEDAAEADLLIVQPWGSDATSCAIARQLDPAKTVALDPLTALEQHRTLMLTAITSNAARDAARALLCSDGVAVSTINDSPGFIVQRVLASIVNIAATIAQRRIASVDDIEDAVKLGLGYPQGPLSWGDRIGAKRILDILQKMHAQTGDPRYRPNPWLQRRAALAVSLLTPEAAREAHP